MKIVITTTKNPDTIASYYSKYLSAYPGLDLCKAMTFDLEEEYTSKGFIKKVKAHYLPQLLTNIVSTHLEELVIKYKPNVLIVIKGQYISGRILERIKKLGVFLVNYNPDHPNYFEIRTPGKKNIQNSLGLYDLVLTYSPVIEHHLNRYIPTVKTGILPFGYELSSYNANLIEGHNLIRKVCFAGTADQARSEFISDLLKNEISVDVYGRGFDRYFSDDTKFLKIHPQVTGESYLKILQRYMIDLNLYRNQNRGSHNMRSFEIPSVGGIQIVEHSEQMEAFFKKDEEILFYHTKNEMRGMIQEMLKASEEIILTLKNKIRSKTLNAPYSYENRTSELISMINSII